MHCGQLSPKPRDFSAVFGRYQRQLVLCIQAAVWSVTKLCPINYGIS